MGNGENGAEKNTNTADDDVSDAQEGVTSTHNGASADDDGLCTLVIGCWEDFFKSVVDLVAWFLVSYNH